LIRQSLSRVQLKTANLGMMLVGLFFWESLVLTTYYPKLASSDGGVILYHITIFLAYVYLHRQGYYLLNPKQ
jgi:uncharacterized membrane protein